MRQMTPSAPWMRMVGDLVGVRLVLLQGRWAGQWRPMIASLLPEGLSGQEARLHAGMSVALQLQVAEEVRASTPPGSLSVPTGRLWCQRHSNLGTYALWPSESGMSMRPRRDSSSDSGRKHRRWRQRLPPIDSSRKFQPHTGGVRLRGLLAVVVSSSVTLPLVAEVVAEVVHSLHHVS